MNEQKLWNEINGTETISDFDFLSIDTDLDQGQEDIWSFAD